MIRNPAPEARTLGGPPNIGGEFDHVTSATNALRHEAIRRVAHLSSNDQTRRELMDIDPPLSSFKENVPLARVKFAASTFPK